MFYNISGPSIAQWEKINGTGVSSYFDSIIVSGDLEVEKPSKLIFDLAFSELQVCMLYVLDHLYI